MDGMVVARNFLLKTESDSKEDSEERSLTTT